MKRLEQSVIDNIVLFHGEYHSNRTIADKLNIHHRTVAYYLHKEGLKSNKIINQPIDMVDDKNARCSKCTNIKPIGEFLINRRGQKYEYRFSYCNGCRKKQTYLNLNSNKDKFLKDRFNRVKRRCLNDDIAFDLDFDYFKGLFDKQEGKCFYTDIDMIVTVGNKLKPNSMSIDRIIPENGYTKGNIVFCINRINSIKNNVTLEEMKDWMPRWYQRIINFQVNYGDF